MNLPRDELSAMAESLINLTSFKRRVSMQAENVGGPIDVAVITKQYLRIQILKSEYPVLNRREPSRLAVVIAELL